MHVSPTEFRTGEAKSEEYIQMIYIYMYVSPTNVLMGEI